MANIRIVAVALAGSSLAAVPAQAGGVLGGGSCLCNVVGGVLGGAPSAPSIGNPTGGRSGTVSRATGSGLSRHGSITGSVSNSVNGTLGVTTARSIDRRNGTVAGNVGLAGTVSSVTNAAVGANGIGKSMGLAGSSSTSGSVNKQLGFGLTGVGTNHGRSLAGQVAGTANTVVRQTRGTGHGSAASLAGTVNAMANATLAKTHGGSQSGSNSLTAAVNSAANGAVAITKNHGGANGGQGNSKSLTGRLNSTTNGALALTKTHGGGANNGGGGTPGGPGLGDLVGGAGDCLCETAKNLIGGASGSNGGGSGNDGSNSSNGSNSGNSGNGSAGSGGGASQGSTGSAPGGNSRERDTADRKDLWWPPHPTQQSREGRLQDH